MASATILIGIILVVMWIATLLLKAVDSPSSKPASDISDHAKARKERLKQWREVSAYRIARKLGGKVVDESGRSVIHWEQNKFRYLVYVSTRNRVSTIRVRTQWPEKEFRMRLFPNFKKKQRHLGIQDLNIGCREFDQDYVIQGNCVEDVKRVLPLDVRDRIEKHKEHSQGRIDLDIYGGAVQFGGMSNRFVKEREVVSIVRNYADIHFRMWLAWSSATEQQLQIDYAELEQSVCMVCGEIVNDDDGVECEECSTRHHRDCWKYIGRCSTYGCEGKKAG